MNTHGRIGCLMVAVPFLRLRTPRRLTARQRLADWIVGGDYSDALDLRDTAVQNAATRPLRAQLAADEAPGYRPDGLVN